MTRIIIPTLASTAFISTLVAVVCLSSCGTLALSVGVNTVHKHSSILPLPLFMRTSSSKSSCYISTANIYSGLPASYRRKRTSCSSIMMNTDDDEDSSSQPPTTTLPLCDLQTFLRLCDLVESGGQAKTAIQDSKCLLNGVTETRRSKKLFDGDKVSFGDAVDVDVATEVKKKGYVFKPKVKKVKPLPKVDADGNVEFGGRYRSEEWRAERKLKKAERKKSKNE